MYVLAGVHARIDTLIGCLCTLPERRAGVEFGGPRNNDDKAV